MESRRLVDEAAGCKDTKIMASGNRNEYIIRDLVYKADPIESIGVGTEQSTSKDDPAMNGVYKLMIVRVHSTQEEDDKKKRIRIIR